MLQYQVEIFYVHGTARNTHISNVATALYFDLKGDSFWGTIYVCLPSKTMKNARINFTLVQDPLDMVWQSLSYNVQ